MNARRLIAGTVVVAGCLPTRDNPNDTQNRPAAVLRVVDHTESIDPATGIANCSDDFGAAVEYPDFGVASRGRCLAFDARGSTDPNGEALRFRYEAAGVELATSDDPVLLIDGTTRRAMPTGVPIPFSVAAIDPHGVEDVATATATLLNGRPVVLAEPAYYLPLGGYAWSPAADHLHPFRVPFAYDPDGDPLDVCWTFPDESEPICRRDPLDPDFTRALPSDLERRYVAEVYVTDSATRSSPATAEVRVGHGPVWSFSYADGLVEHLDGLDRTVVFPTGADATSHLPPEAAAMFGPASNRRIVAAVRSVYGFPEAVFGGLRVAVSNADGSSQAVAPASQAAEWFWAPGASGMALAGNEDGDRVWAVGSRPGDGDYSLTVFQDAGQSLAEIRHEVLPMTEGGALALLLAVGGDGTAWTTALLGTALHAVPETGTRSGIFDPERAYTALARRPGDGTVWAVDAANPEGGDASTASLLRLGDGGGPPTEVLPLDRAYAYGLAWANETEVWLGVAGEGLFLLDVGLLEGGAPLGAAALQFFPEIAVDHSFRPVVDPVSGDCWVSGTDAVGNSVHRRAARNGSFAEIPNQAGSLLFVDDAGGLWFGFDDETDPADPALAFDVVRSGTPALQTGVSLRKTYLGILRRPVLDPATGGVWVATSYPPTLLLLSADGRAHRIVNAASDGDDAVPLGMLGTLALTPDGRWMWAFEESDSGPLRIVRFDLSVDPPAFDEVFGDAALMTEFDNNRVLLPSRPVATAGDFAWVVRGYGTSGFVAATLDAGGTLTDRFTVPPTEHEGVGVTYFAPGAALDPVTNDLCFVTVSNTSGGAVVRRLSPAGAVAELGQVPIGGLFGTPQLGELHAATSFDADGGSLCWVVHSFSGPNVGTRAVVSALRPDGEVAHTFVQDDVQIKRVRPLGEDRMWILRVPLDGGPDDSLSQKVRVDFENGVLTSSGTIVLAPSGDESFDLLVPVGN